ncbi:hypothetical protein AM593_09328, partial [Mytilus galloprovincialis]
MSRFAALILSFDAQFIIRLYCTASRTAKENIQKEIKDYFNDMKQKSTDAISEAGRTTEENVKKEIKDYFKNMKQKSTDAISEASRTAEQNIKKEIKDYFDDMKQNSTDALSGNSIYYILMNGVFKIFPKGTTGFNVYCDMETDGGRWTIDCSLSASICLFTKLASSEMFSCIISNMCPEVSIASVRRQDGKGDFYRDCLEYVKGFGDVKTEFWLDIGRCGVSANETTLHPNNNLKSNDKLHDLTSQGSYELRVDLEDFNGDKAYAKYSTFNIGDQSTNYTLTVNGYSGTAGRHSTWRYFGSLLHMLKYKIAYAILDIYDPNSAS